MHVDDLTNVSTNRWNDFEIFPQFSFLPRYIIQGGIDSYSSHPMFYYIFVLLSNDSCYFVIFLNINTSEKVLCIYYSRGCYWISLRYRSNHERMEGRPRQLDSIDPSTCLEFLFEGEQRAEEARRRRQGLFWRIEPRFHTVDRENWIWDVRG